MTTTVYDLPPEIIDMIFSQLNHKKLKIIGRCSDYHIKSLATIIYKEKVRDAWILQFQQINDSVEESRSKLYYTETVGIFNRGRMVRSEQLFLKRFVKFRTIVRHHRLLSNYAPIFKNLAKKLGLECEFDYELLDKMKLTIDQAYKQRLKIKRARMCEQPLRCKKRC